MRGLDDATAVRAMALALQSPCEVSGAAHLPAALAGGVGVDDCGGRRAVTALRLEGFEASVETGPASSATCSAVRRPSSSWSDEPSADFWAAIRDVKPLVATAGTPGMAAFGAAGRRRARGGGSSRRSCRREAILDWGGGLVWLAVDPRSSGPGRR